MLERTRLLQMDNLGYKNFSRLYPQLIGKYPHLQSVGIEIIIKDRHNVLANSGGGWSLPRNNISERKISLKDMSVTRISHPMSERVGALTVFASLLDVTPDFLLQNQKILNMCAVLHEFGHENDYVMNYEQNTNRLDPVRDYNDRRDLDMGSLPVQYNVPGQVLEMYKTGELQKIFLENEYVYRNIYNIQTAYDLFLNQDYAYRNLPTEHAADLFMAEKILEYWDLLEFPQR